MGDFRIEQEGDFIRAYDVPVFDEHKRNGTTFDEKKLKTIVDNCNKRIKDTGDFCPLIPGHIPDDVPEEDAQILGWASNFRIGDWGKENPRKAIFADFKFTKEQWEKAKKLPRRSVELWDYKSDTAYIDPIALLSKSTPERDLGLLYEKPNNNNIYKYSIGETMTNEEMAVFVHQCIEKYMAEKDKVEEDENKETNESEEDSLEESKDAIKLQRDQERRKYARLENEHKLVCNRIEALEKQERISSRRADLLSIEQEGILFDMAEELENVSEMPNGAYEKHLNVMRKRYSKAPIGVNLNNKVTKHIVAPEKEVNNMDFSLEDVKQAAELMLSGKAKSTDEAFKLVRSK